MDHEWGDWPEDEFTGETADLSGVDEPAAGPGGYEEPAGADGPPATEPADRFTDAGGGGADGGSDGPAGDGYLEDDPMAGLEPAGADDPGGDGTDSDPVAAAEPDDRADAAGPENVVGADPDVDPNADWSPPAFPEQLELAPPEPVDGYPWSDPAAVAAPGTGGADPTIGPDAAPPAQDLLDYAATDGGGGDPWAALVGSEDPAANSLGRWWAPAG